ncbi:type VI secretion system tube protein TssD [Hymenobacter psoromatis]|uniref:type VI secretion system tube protein TssD n=1 Tax=Hymenobacter psoromatis TaxID=1484116 RepID=UPI001CBDF962|nr:type VI secretion system tube protein TssD [Hymenobacter psoromatis]
MSDFQVTLLLDGNAIRVREYHWAIVQTTDEMNRPQGGVLAGKLHVVLDCLAHPVVDAWMADSRKTMSGELLVLGPDGQRARTIRFTDAYCVNQGLFFDGMSNQQAGALSVLLSAHTLLVDQELEIRNVWPLDHGVS